MGPLGLTSAASAAYRVALTQPGWAVDELVDQVERLTGVSGSEAYALVTELLDLALLRPSTEDGVPRLRVIAPEVALEDRLAAERLSALQAQQRLERGARLVTELQEQYRAAGAAHLEQSIERLTGLDAIRGRLEQLAREASQEVLSFMRGAQSAESMDASRPLDEAALSRGVSLRGIHQHSSVNDPTTVSYMRWLGERGAEVRTVATLPLQMIIVDRSVAVLPLDVDQQGAGAQLVRGSGMLTALLALFESVWSSARPVGERRQSVVAELSDTEREILRLLGAGATDDLVARQLSVSVRTVRRLTATLMARYGAQSRFELGVRLGAAGWQVAAGGAAARWTADP